VMWAVGSGSQGPFFTLSFLFSCPKSDILRLLVNEVILRHTSLFQPTCDPLLAHGLPVLTVGLILTEDLPGTHALGCSFPSLGTVSPGPECVQGAVAREFRNGFDPVCSLARQNTCSRCLLSSILACCQRSKVSARSI
jgi:hypothetical protein